MKVIVAENQEIASKNAASMLCKQIKKKPSSVFLLPTGSTPLQMYSILLEKFQAGKISFAHTQSFNLDEYLGIKEGNKQSYHFFMQKNFFGKIDIKKANTNIPSSNPASPEKFCKAYEKKIKQAGLDLAVLGIGENGHIGFNEPGTSFNSETHVASLTKSTIKANSRLFSSKEKVPTKAITCGLKTIMRAKKVVLLAFGKKKAKAVRDALEKKPSSKVPASILQGHPNAFFILDREAASLLKKKEFLPPKFGNIKLFSDFNLPKGKKIAFFSPHPDDAPICAGALLSELSKNNKVFEIIMTTGHHAAVSGKNQNQRILLREREVRAGARIIGTKPIFLRCRFYENGGDILESDLRKVRAAVKKIKPDIAFVPQKLDPHPRHSLSRKLALASLPHNTELWSFETPWGLFAHEKFNTVFEFSEKIMRKKLKAI